MREAIIQLDDDQLEAIGLAEVVAATREAGLRDVTELVCHGAGGLLQVEVDGPIPAADLDDFEAVEWWERLTAGETSDTYLLRVQPPNDLDGCVLGEHATAHEVEAVRENGFGLSVVGSQEEIGESVAAIDDAGMRPLLLRLTDFEGSEPSLVAGLTDQQRAVVETAYAMGYYEVPKEASTEDVAAKVGLEPSTVAEHLQRAERNLLGPLLDHADRRGTSGSHPRSERSNRQ